jgi:hypothetical protein
LFPQRPCAVGFVLRLSGTIPGAEFATLIVDGVAIRMELL